MSNHTSVTYDEPTTRAARATFAALAPVQREIIAAYAQRLYDEVQALSVAQAWRTAFAHFGLTY